MYDSTENMNEYLRAFIDELEEEMPSSFIAMNLQATNQGISMSVQCENYTNAAEVIQQLRKFETLDPESISAPSFQLIKEEEVDADGNVIEPKDDEDVETTVSFGLTAKYNLNYRLEQKLKDAQGQNSDKKAEKADEKKSDETAENK